MDRTVELDTCIDVETWEEAHFLVRLDFELLRGEQFTVNYYTVHEGDDTVDVYAPLSVRLEDSFPKQFERDLRNTVDEYVDPYWDLIACRSEDLQGRQSPWTLGPSYRVLEAVQPRHRVGDDGGLRG